MYAIVKIGGNQYKISLAQLIDVDKLQAKEGETVKFPALLVVSDEKVELGTEAKQVEILFSVVKHFQGKKVDVSRYRHKTRHRRHIGFRPQMTQLKVMAIGSKKAVSESKIIPKNKSTSKTKKIA